ncbi:MAG: bifunctional phosphopantothenoylcysteine decarboxylase/phosphopantothenate--cysteine ligase CoaBC [Synergistales bacterium]|nr:bifunctional phosphopantothenoylcysteine decarboxylase/phosphopantothenate--cysteine ligase CoaBC [Synergistales bacterium]MDY6402042.1 bifunctional phosphopantothenoylcysteine decarboxylase/phosphopantothenate--cysteine ligase CoaBC [Synergistales bacterium]MDY6410831.1 bifunctional phosphopantothenoylcysteine decarboxylase/phosphopantothenate--cysteine ligase CoaBC [Synergistales bacterium]MDY6413974.1 bifunctional phosphopantothenoylcysteine decarboxylase/phosphopantothenate--cysteine liga
MNNWKAGRKILLGITGGIAAYKIPGLVRLIKKAGCESEIILTDAAKNFVAPMTLETLSGKKIWTENNFDFNIPHIKLTQWADVFVIAPCTANTLAKIAHGISDNLLTSAVIASTCPILIFPAMNENMYANKATQENIKILSERGIKVINPAEGDLACGVSGVGRMNEPEEILLEIFRALYPVHDLMNKKVLITAGPTHEYLDPVRFISNPSTGKMGAAMARAAWYRGAEVKIISGPVNFNFNSYGFEVIKIKSALEMLEAVKKNLSWADFIVKAAAVGDYRAKNFSPQKIKREGKNDLVIELSQNPDISAEVGKLKRENQILIGFAAETQNISENAREKLARKNLDYILANDVSEKNSGFAVDTNTVKLIPKDINKTEKIFSGLKDDIACEIWDNVISL